MTAPIGCLDEREAFESWFRSEYHDRLCRNMPDKSYNDPTAHATWGAWQARSASRQEGWQPLSRRPPQLCPDGSIHKGSIRCLRPQ